MIIYFINQELAMSACYLGTHMKNNLPKGKANVIENCCLLEIRCR